MRVYYYTFSGEVLGGEIVVIAHNQEEADKYAIHRLNSRYPRLKDAAKTHELTLDCEHDLSENGEVIYFWDGEY